ncbi:MULTISPECIES: type IV pilin protein [Stenotrophomonas]|uniref:type IV pilin protein n=1 Tax=Stenotrophomonas TaxID=40323 RepID=UPI000B4CD8A9|nr:MULTISPECIES: type IV pilin protein [Stenotrophomonas]MBL0733196.1 type IV pilin protein [Stenotrophomonas maltophilia]MBL0756816.1 type IV pilin protein [Stenotrophomonas maltophilia]OWQ69516.1 pilus assembly protein PilE [Stenotrophomonas maltophilia]QEU34049.1 type IV pilin protein [Stenotrophomonas maltophilia]QGL67254.1 type IV pilin protein [Stenotrophomonas maltophilia]
MRRALAAGGMARGFSLIELMIVVAVVAILAAIAYPSYGEHVRKSRRAQVKADLVEYAQLAERYHTVNNTYVGFKFPGNADSINSPREGGAAAYTLSMKTAQSTFTFTATAANSQVKDKCGDLTLNQANVKTSKGTLSECW